MDSRHPEPRLPITPAVRVDSRKIAFPGSGSFVLPAPLDTGKAQRHPCPADMDPGPPQPARAGTPPYLCPYRRTYPRRPSSPMGMGELYEHYKRLGRLDIFFAMFPHLGS